jgi:hypothetical protein
MGTKILQVPVIIGKGEEQFFIEKEICFASPIPAVYKVISIDKWVEVYDKKATCGKVIFNAYLWKNITYKTVERACDDYVSGPVYHYTVKIPFGGFVFIDKDVKEGDIAELLEAKIEGEKDEWGGEECRQGVKVFTKLVEKTVVKLKFKANRIEEVCVKECDEDEENEDCGCDK